MIYKILFFLSILTISTVGAKNIDEKVYTGTIGYLTDGLSDIQYKDTRIAFSLWTKEIALDENIEVKTLFFNHDSDVLGKYLNNDFDAMTINPIFYLQNQKRLDATTQGYYIIQRSQKKYEKLLILVRKDSGIKNISDLQNKIVGIRADSYYGKLFLDKEILKKTHKDPKNYIKKLLTTKRYSTALLKTFFKKTDACVVPAYVFDLLVEMNPSLKRNLMRIVESENIFMPAITIVHTKTPKKLNDAYRRSIDRLDSTQRGKSILSLFKTKKIHFIKLEELEGIKEYYKEYTELKKRYLLKK